MRIGVVRFLLSLEFEETRFHHSVSPASREAVMRIGVVRFLLSRECEETQFYHSVIPAKAGIQSGVAGGGDEDGSCPLSFVTGCERSFFCLDIPLKSGTGARKNQRKSQDCGKKTGNFIVALKQIKYGGDREWRRRSIFVSKRATRSFLTSFSQGRSLKRWMVDSTPFSQGSN
jgi:hypothetical protein